MGRTPLETKQVQVSVYLSPDDAAWLPELKNQLSKTSSTDVFREIVKNLRTWFSLPSFMVEVLQKEAEEKGQNILDYVRDVLGRHAQSLLMEQKGKPEKHKR